jgi:hypothetical protein
MADIVDPGILVFVYGTNVFINACKKETLGSIAQPS